MAALLPPTRCPSAAQRLSTGGGIVPGEMKTPPGAEKGAADG